MIIMNYIESGWGFGVRVLSRRFVVIIDIVDLMLLVDLLFQRNIGVSLDICVNVILVTLSTSLLRVEDEELLDFLTHLLRQTLHPSQLLHCYQFHTLHLLTQLVKHHEVHEVHPQFLLNYIIIIILQWSLIELN